MKYSINGKAWPGNDAMNTGCNTASHSICVSAAVTGFSVQLGYTFLNAHPATWSVDVFSAEYGTIVFVSARALNFGYYVQKQTSKGKFRVNQQPLFTIQRRSRLLIFTACLLLPWTAVDVAARAVSIQEPPDKGVVLEEKDLEARKQLASMIDRIMEDPAVKEKITRTGEERTVYCRVCHGENGNATRPWVPNLAGQNPVYLLDQFQRFADGRRYDKAMTSLAETFTEDEKVLLALYFSQMELSPADIQDHAQWSRGKKIYEVACTQCHGKSGRGEKGYARLAGQQSSYVVKMLKEFRDYTGKRFNPWMTAVTTSLTDEEIADVAAYVSAMK